MDSMVHGDCVYVCIERLSCAAGGRWMGGANGWGTEMVGADPSR